ncbi:ExbD/TolR family protein [Glaciimonas immobilis]|uniref:Biopolymer transport protein ExbD n=1 Tax=Glaciimonas immobilis TaxID=728004 RepID=A0A840S0Z2_9BURK|nr:biopolymer transporter ExbD [Glaciimonas immobilis]KAF3996691.1 biopolymer transporter ExbD [Glaciimonas immobilis]MBB5202544.1 biopolymer transport protein ExbD [Glaciimonas immobilis]
MNFRKGGVREELEINLIPFIDVLLVIVIFLMVTTTYSNLTTLKITLPTTDAAKSVAEPFLINVAVTAQGQYAVNKLQVSAKDAEDLAQDLRSAAQGDPNKTRETPVIVINADALSPHQTVITVLEAARLAGFEKVTFAAQASSKK